MAAPKLRFKEFDGDLTESKLVELTLWASGGTPAKDIPEYWGDDIPLISGASMHTNQLYESDVKITRLGLQKGSKLAPKDSILILVRGSMLFNKIPMGITLGDVAFNQDVKCIRPKQELAPQFLFQWLHAKENTIQNKVTATGIGAGKLDTADLQNLKLYKPSSEEQTKIASFLSNVDEKISQLTQKHQLLSQYKQGMMQKLFSQQIRFNADDGSEFGEWEETTLGEIGTFKSGQGFPEQFQGGKDGIPFFKVSDMNILGNEKIMKVANNYVNSEAITKMKAKVIDNEAIIFAKVGAAIFLERKRLAKNFLIDNNMMAYLSNQKTNIMFLKQFLDNIKLSKFVQVGALPSYNSSDLAIIPISLPCLEEQTKIANFLSAIDQKLEVVAQQIEQDKQWKKGLLQQMFV